MKQTDLTREDPTQNDRRLSEWMDLDADGALGAEERRTLEAQLAERPELARQRRALEGLHSLIAESRIPVAAGFSERVMAALPAVPWRQTERRAVPVWGLPLAVMLAFALGAAWLLSGSGLLGGGAVVGTILAMLDLAKTSVLAGSGLLYATWRGIGFGLEEVIGASPGGLVAFGILVLCLDLLFLSMLRRRRPAVVTADEDDD